MKNILATPIIPVKAAIVSHAFIQKPLVRAVALTAFATAALPAFATDWWTTMPAPTYGSTKIEVRDKGALGDGVHDDRDAFQKAINALPSAGGIVHVTPGKYVINATGAPCPTDIPPVRNCGIILRSHMMLSMDVGAELVVKTASQERYNLISAWNKNNIEIVGGRIIGDRVTHTDPGGGKPGTNEHGFGIGIYGSSNILIKWTEASKFWGDGFYVASGGGSKSTYITFDHVASSDNRRQGLSIIGGVQYLYVKNSTFSDTNGTKPEDGIDIEPNDALGNPTSFVRFKNNIFTGNHGNGLELTSGTSDITFVQNTTEKNHGAGVYAKNTVNFNMTSNKADNNGLQGVYLGGTTHDSAVINNELTCNYTTHYPKSCIGGGSDRDLFADLNTYTITISGNTLTPSQ